MNVTDETILKRLVEGETGQRMAAAIMREAMAERIKISADIETLRRERGEKTAPLNADTAAKRAKLDAARAALAAAENEYNAAAQHEAATAGSYDARIAATERKLIATAPACIDALLTELSDMESEAKATQILQRRQATNRINTRTSGTIMKVYSNAASLRERLEAIRHAREEARKLKGRVLSDADINERLQQLRDTLPEIQMRFSHES